MHDHDHAHTHDNIDDHIHEHLHAHEHSHGHGHTHSHTQTKAVVNRLSRALGHLESVKRMVEDGRDCTEVLIQLAAVRAALGNTAKVILKDHIEHCIVDAAVQGDKQALDDLNAAIERFMQ
jgi:DNA-binding FrmR family transcriptional regulator